MIRRATEYDLDGIRAVYREVWPGYDFTPLPDEADFVALDGERIVGAIRFVPEAGGLVRRGRAVLPAYRRSGFGRALLDAVHTEAAGRTYFSVATVESAGQSVKRLGATRLEVGTARSLLAAIDQVGPERVVELLRQLGTLRFLTARAEAYHHNESQRYTLLVHCDTAVASDAEPGATADGGGTPAFPGAQHQ